ncbi:hypothetical protein PENTCL1PPCAC_836, partial [Pristionchus entomophagus]
MSMKALGRSSARRGLAPALKKEHDLLKLVLITAYRGVAFEDIMNKYSSLADSYLAPSLAKVAFPLVAYFAFHLYLLYICILAIFKQVYEKTVIGGYAAAWVGRLADQYNAWQYSRLPRIIPPPIRVQINEEPKLQPMSPTAPGTHRTAAAAAAAAAEDGCKGAAPRSSPNSSPRASNSATSVDSSSAQSTDSASSTALSSDQERGGASSSLSSLSTTTSSENEEEEDDEKDDEANDAVPFPFSADPPPRSSPRASLESSDKSRASSSSSDLTVSTPDFATPPQSPVPITVVKRAPAIRVRWVTTLTIVSLIRSDPADSLQMPPAPLPAPFSEKKKEKKKKDKEKKPAKGAATKGESEEDEMTGQKEGDDSERAAKRRLEKMEKRLKKEREILRVIRAKKKALETGSLRKINEDKSSEYGRREDTVALYSAHSCSSDSGSSTSSDSSNKRKHKTEKSQFAKKVAKADSIRQRRESNNSKRATRKPERRRRRNECRTSS